jgi:hypothetical protein
MIERRAVNRTPLDQLALLHVQGVPGVHPCRVKDINDQGAGLDSSPSGVIAREFRLSLDGFRTGRHCHIVWHRGATCGVKFTDKTIEFPKD